MNSKENFITVASNDELVAKYISCYYFHSSDDSDFRRKFTFYPNYRHALTVYNNCTVDFNPSGSIVRESLQSRNDVFYTINTNRSFNVDIKGRFNKIGIVFNPLGINHFIKSPLHEIFNSAFHSFIYFGDAFQDTVKAVFAEPNVNKKGEILDNFFHKNFTEFDEPMVKKALQEILNTGGSIKVEELSDVLNTNRKTLLRQFKKHLCCSIEEYKKMVMFRNALDYSQQQKYFSLTDVALYSLYYDQAHYIKHFKSVTELSPKALLSQITKLGSGVYWNFEN